MTTTTTTATQTETVSVSKAMGRMKKTALIGTAVAGLAVVGFYGYQLYKKSKTVIDVVAAPTTTEETAVDVEAPVEAA